MKPASAESRSQLWSDGTNLRQKPFSVLVIGLLRDVGTVHPVVVSSCIFMDDEQQME